MPSVTQMFHNFLIVYMLQTVAYLSITTPWQNFPKMYKQSLNCQTTSSFPCQSRIWIQVHVEMLLLISKYVVIQFIFAWKFITRRGRCTMNDSQLQCVFYQTRMICDLICNKGPLQSKLLWADLWKGITVKTH